MTIMTNQENAQTLDELFPDLQESNGLFLAALDAFITLKEEHGSQHPHTKTAKRRLDEIRKSIELANHTDRQERHAQELASRD